MRQTLEIPRLSLAERDRRWAAVRKEMASRGLDAIVLWGWPVMWDFYTANARYLAPIGGNAEYNVLVFPADGDPTSIIQLPTFIDGWRAAQGSGGAGAAPLNCGSHSVTRTFSAGAALSNAQLSYGSKPRTSRRPSASPASIHAA